MYEKNLLIFVLLKKKNKKKIYMEQWKEIVNFEGIYEVSSLGQGSF